MSATNADAENRSALGDLIEGRPLNRQKNWVAHGKRRQTDRAEANSLSVRRQCGEHGDRFQARLVDQAVADPHRFENTRLLGRDGGFDQLVNIRWTLPGQGYARKIACASGVKSRI